MRIGGFQKVSLIDYPGKVAAVVFVGGCNFRCPYCYNRDLVLGSDKLPAISEEEVLAYLKKRKGLVDGVVLTGGEPTLQKDLSGFARKIKDLNLLVKLDTNGSNPAVMQKLLDNHLVDYVALDVKAPLDGRYLRVVGWDQRKSAHNQCKSIEESLAVLQNSKIDFELRTTVVPTLHSEKDLLDLAKQLKKILNSQFSTLNSPSWFLQNFQPKNCLDPSFGKIKPYERSFFEKLLPKIRVDIPNAQLRQ